MHVQQARVPPAAWRAGRLAPGCSAPRPCGSSPPPAPSRPRKRARLHRVRPRPRPRPYLRPRPRPRLRPRPQQQPRCRARLRRRAGARTRAVRRRAAGSTPCSAPPGCTWACAWAGLRGCAAAPHSTVDGPAGLRQLGTPGCSRRRGSRSSALVGPLPTGGRWRNTGWSTSTPRHACRSCGCTRRRWPTARPTRRHRQRRARARAPGARARRGGRRAWRARSPLRALGSISAGSVRRCRQEGAHGH